MNIRDKLISGPVGFGAVPLGNMFRNTPDAEAAAPWQNVTVGADFPAGSGRMKDGDEG
jgi:hypothetical protein